MTVPPLLSAAAALAVVLAAIMLIGRVARLTRFAGQNGRNAGQLKLLETLSLDPRRRLLLVTCDGRRVLLLTGQQDRVVGWLPDQAG